MTVRRRLLGALLGTILSTTAAAQTAAPTLSRPTTPESAPTADGFIQRWLILEPIGADGLTDSAVRAAVTPSPTRNDTSSSSTRPSGSSNRTPATST